MTLRERRKSQMKIFIISPQSSAASESARKPGDNALFVIIKELKKLGCLVTGNEVALLPKDAPLPLKRRAKAIINHKVADVSLIMGADAVRNVKSWFPVTEAISSPQPFFYINDPGRIEIELFEKIKDAYKPVSTIYGFNEEDNTIGGAI